MWQNFENSNDTEVLLINFEKYSQIEKIFSQYSQVISKKYPTNSYTSKKINILNKNVVINI